jgi:hypothetical protein
VGKKLNHIQRTWLEATVWHGGHEEPSPCWIPQPTGEQLAQMGLVTCVEHKGNNRRRYLPTPAGRAEVKE